MKYLPEVGDRVYWNNKSGVVTSLCDEGGVVQDKEDAISLTVEWEDGTFSALLVTDMEYIQSN